MTKSQERIVELLRKEIFKNDCFDNPEEYEFKEWKVTEKKLFEDYKNVKTKTLVYVLAITGMKDDEGTMASIFCRKRRHFVIGERGGVKGLAGKKVTGFRKAMIYSYDH